MIGAITVMVVSLLCAYAIPIENSETTYFENEADEKGYHFKYETSDGVSRSERGYFGGENGTLKVSGEYELRYPDGKLVRVTYSADEKGYSQKTAPGAPVKPVAPFRTRIASAAIASLAGGGLGR